MVEVNGVRLPLKDFPARFVVEALVGMCGSLHGGEDIRSLRVELCRVSKGSQLN